MGNDVTFRPEEALQLTHFTMSYLVCLHLATFAHISCSSIWLAQQSGHQRLIKSQQSRHAGVNGQSKEHFVG